MSLYQRTAVSTGSPVGAPGPLPACLVGLAECTLADLPAHLGEDTLAQLGLADTGFLPVADPPPAAPRILARIDFIRRFTTAEMAQVQGSADPVVKAFLFMLTLVDAVDLDNADTVAGVHYLETTSPPLIAPGRAGQVLA